MAFSLSEASVYIREVSQAYQHASRLLSNQGTEDELSCSLASMQAAHSKLGILKIQLVEWMRNHGREQPQVPSQSTIEQIVTLRRAVGSLSGQLQEKIQIKVSTSDLAADVVLTGNRGRPRYDINRDQIIFLREYGFSWKRISTRFGISAAVLYRRRAEMGLGLGDDELHISREELDSEVMQLKQRNPSWGVVMVEGYLYSRGITVSRCRVQESLTRVDPLFTSLRWQAPIERRRYRVAGPGSLWHIDGNHKLIRYGIVIHGGIDGYSRLIVFLRASTNNRAETVFKGFTEALESFGAPSRIRTDHGGENMMIGEHMISIRPEGHNAWLRGSSVHNQRIERLWRDMRHSVTNYWREFLMSLEQQGLMNPMLIGDRHAVIYVFLPMINDHLREWVEAWNSHKMRTESQQTPYQLFISGMLDLRGTGHTATQEIFDQEHINPEVYGVDPDELTDQPEDGGTNFDELIDLPQTLVSRLDSELGGVIYENAYEELERYIEVKRICEEFHGDISN